jgi:hypothetical protein
MLSSTNAFIAGSYVTNLTTPFKNNQKPNDMDIYITSDIIHNPPFSKEMYTLSDVVKKNIDNIHSVLLSYGYEINIEEKCRDFVNTSHYDLCGAIAIYEYQHKSFLPIQLILTTLEMNDLLKTFDLECCARAWNGVHLYCIKNIKFNKKHSELDYNSNVMNFDDYTSLERIIKYKNRGFNIYHINLIHNGLEQMKKYYKENNMFEDIEECELSK